MSNEKKSWSWEKRHEDWTVIMDIYSPPCGAVFQDHLHQKYQLLIKNADSSSHPRPTDFYFLGLDCRNLYFEQVLEHTNVLGKTLPKCKCKSYLQRHNLMFQISLSSGYNFGNGISSLKHCLVEKGHLESRTWATAQVGCLCGEKSFHGKQCCVCY